MGILDCWERVKPHNRCPSRGTSRVVRNRPRSGRYGPKQAGAFFIAITDTNARPNVKSVLKYACDHSFNPE